MIRAWEVHRHQSQKHIVLYKDIATKNQNLLETLMPPLKFWYPLKLTHRKLWRQVSFEEVLSFAFWALDRPLLVFFLSWIISLRVSFFTAWLTRVLLMMLNLVISFSLCHPHLLNLYWSRWIVWKWFSIWWVETLCSSIATWTPLCDGAVSQEAAARMSQGYFIISSVLMHKQNDKPWSFRL